MHKRFENLEEALCRELEKLDRKYGTDNAEMAVQDVERADVLYHALKSAETYHAMKDAEEMDEEDEESGATYGRRGGTGRSGAARRRDSRGRYTSYGMPEDGYAGRYSEGYSGWMPPMYSGRY